MWYLIDHPEKKWPYFVALFFPFFSSLVHGGFAIEMYLIIILILSWRKLEKNSRMSYLLFFVILTFSYVFVNYRLFYQHLLDSSYVSHREGYVLAENSLQASLSTAINYLINGHMMHFPSLHKYIIIPLSFFSTLILIFRGIRFRLMPFEKYFLLVMLFHFLISFVFGILSYGPIARFISALPLFRSFTLYRIIIVHATLWYLSFFAVIHILSRSFRNCVILGNPFVYFFLAVSISLQLGLALIQLPPLSYPRRNFPSFDEYLSSDLFQRIKNDIQMPENSYRSICLGIDPSVALMNGFFTLDGMFTDYPLSYKKKFSDLLVDEIQDDQTLWRYFYNWGNCLVLMSSEISVPFQKNSLPISVSRFRMNHECFKSMGGLIVLSRFNIMNAADLGLELMKEYENSCYRISVYRSSNNTAPNLASE